MEFAIVLFPLLLLVLGIAQFGTYYSRQLAMQHASREAARVIALKYDDPGMTPAALQAEAETALVDVLWVTNAADLVQVSPTYQLCDVAGFVTEARVTLQHDPDLSLPLVNPGGIDVSIDARAVMPCEG